MRTKLMQALWVLALSSMVNAADAPKTDGAPNKPLTATFHATNEKMSSVLDRVVETSKARILLETTAADVKVTTWAKDLPVEDALTALCKAGELEWRKVYIKADSSLLKKPDSMASTIRLIAGMQFPDILIEATSKPESLVHIANRPAVDSIPEKLRKDLGMVTTYVVTNDKAAKIASDKANTNVEKYKKLQKDQMDLFMKMTPEEREQALSDSANQMQQMDPKILSEMSMSVMKNPELMKKMMDGQSSFLMQMTPDDRRALIRSQMQAQEYMSPELKQMLQEDAIAVMKEMGKLPADFKMPEQPQPQQ